VTDALPPIIAGRYRPLRELGRGGMGVVYVVEHVHTGDQLALKLLHGRAASDANSIERFKREARASARIKSENVVKVLDADVAPELGGAPFLVMELLDGSDLQKQSEQRGPLPAGEIFAHLTQVARALDRSHSMGIIHRDLKPENLFLHHREDGSVVVKVLDFGISKFMDGDLAGAGMTHTGAVMGTPLYMAPEQAHGRVTQIGPCTDVWAIGLIALHLITGEIYWTAGTLAELMVQIISDPPPYNPRLRWTWLPPGFDDWFARSTARDPTKRFGSVGEQVAALGVALGVQVADRPATPQLMAGHAPGAYPVRIQELPPSAGQSPWPPPAPPGASVNAATALAGAQTTTGPTSRERETGAVVPRRPRTPIAVIAAAVVVFGTAGGLGLVKWSMGRSASTGAGSSPETVIAAGVATSDPPAASTGAGGGPGGAGAAAITPTIAPDAAPISSPAAQARQGTSGGAAPVHHTDRARPRPTTSTTPVTANAPVAAAAPVAAPPPAPGPASVPASAPTTKTEYKPSGL
jgi:predicted Ser/Thr protein kinase